MYGAEGESAFSQTCKESQHHTASNLLYGVATQAMWDSRFNDPLEHALVTRAKGVGTSFEFSLGDHLVTVLYLCTHIQVVSKSWLSETDRQTDRLLLRCRACRIIIRNGMTRESLLSSKLGIEAPVRKIRVSQIPVRLERVSGMDASQGCLRSHEQLVALPAAL